MGTISKFYQVTNLLLLEYKTNQYDILNSTNKTKKMEYYMYKGIDNKQYCLNTSHLYNHIFAFDKGGTNYFPNIDTEEPFIFEENNYQHTISSDADKILTNDTAFINGNYPLGTIIKSVNNSKPEKHYLRSIETIYDTMRLYFPVGYFMNNIDGVMIKVEVPITKAKLTENTKNYINIKNLTAKNYDTPFEYKKISGSINLLNYFIPKGYNKDKVQWLPTPMYFNSKFYDRYIEIEFPAPLYLGSTVSGSDIDFIYTESWLHPLTREYVPLQYRGVIDRGIPFNVSVSSVSSNYVTSANSEKRNTTNKVDKGDFTFVPDSATKFSIQPETYSKYFNAMLYEDPDNGVIIYQPAYGEPDLGHRLSEFDIDTMNQIEQNAIHIYDLAEYDSMNDYIAEFAETYGEGTFKWCIINELSVTYNYDYIIKNNSSDVSTPSPIHEYINNTIDYTGKTYAHGEFWKSKFIPHCPERYNMHCTSIALRYTAHLYNRMNQREIVRTASYVITNPMKYQRNFISTSSIQEMKVVNKIYKQEYNTQSVINKAQTAPTSINASQTIFYHDVGSMIINVKNNTLEESSNTILNLVNGPANYMFTVQSRESGSLIPVNLSSPSQDYKLVFPLVGRGGKTITIYPLSTSTTTKYSKTDGKLLYYITAEQANQIMSAVGDKIFYIIAENKNNTNNDQTIFQGKVQWKY